MDTIELLSDRLHQSKQKIEVWKVRQDENEQKIRVVMKEIRDLQEVIDNEQMFIDILEKNIRDLENTDSHVPQTPASY